MARYVLLAFESNVEAETFVNAVPIEGGVFFIGSDGHFNNVTVEKTRVRGLWAKPTKMCECPNTVLRNFVRGPKFGWYSCAKCSGTHPGWARGEHLYQSLGKNMLPVSAEAPEWRGEGIANHTWNEGSREWIHVITGEPFDAKKVFRGRRNDGI